MEMVVWRRWSSRGCVQQFRKADHSRLSTKRDPTNVSHTVQVISLKSNAIASRCLVPNRYIGLEDR